MTENKGAALWGAGFLALAYLFALGYLANQLTTGSVPVATIVALSVLGIAGFAILLFGIAVAFRIMDAFEPKYAFGLPRGTVRSILALGLLVAFMTGSFYWVDRAATQAPLQVTKHELDADANADLEALQKALGPEIQVFWSSRTETRAVPKDDGSGETEEKTTVFRTINFVDRKANEEWLDLVKQVITVLSTSLAAVVGFYFGSRATDTSPKDEQDARAEAERQNQAGQASAQEAAARELMAAISTDAQRAKSAAEKVKTAHAEAVKIGADEMSKMLLASQLENANKAYSNALTMEKQARELIAKIEETRKKLAAKGVAAKQAAAYREEIAKAMKALKQQAHLAHAAGDRAQKLAGWSEPQAEPTAQPETPSTT